MENGKYVVKFTCKRTLFGNVTLYRYSMDTLYMRLVSP